MSQSRLESAFESGAVKFNLSESDYLVLRSDGFSCYENLFYRLPTREDLERYLEDTLHKKGAYRDSVGTIMVYDKAHPEWRTWRSSDDAACVRKLWSYGSTLCKSELEDMASGSGTGEKIKITPGAAAELERKAIAAGMPKPVSDAERPSSWTLQRLANNFSLGGKHLHVEWESYVSLEKEERAARSGKSLRSKPAVFLVGGKTLEVQEQEVELDGVQKVTGLVSMQEILLLRARVFAMLELTPFSLMTKLNERYTGLVRQTVPDKMRPPTLNEIRRFDRELMKQALRWKSDGQGELGDCLEHYLDNPSASLWRMLEAVPEGVPDQGIERAQEVGQPGQNEGKVKDPSRGVKRGADGTEHEDEPGRKLKTCLVCSKKHEPLCPLPPNFRKQQREAAKQAKKKAKEKKLFTESNRDSSVTGFFLRPATGKKA